MSTNSSVVIFAIVSLCLLAASPVARAEEIVSLAGGYGVLNSPKKVSAAVVLIPGGDGDLALDPSGIHRQQRSPIVSTRADYRARGIASLLIDAGVSATAAIEYMRRLGVPVTVVGESNGSLRAAGALDAHPDGLVLWSGRLQNIQEAIGSPSRLPPTLVIHDPQDRCPLTPPEAVAPFKAWGGGRVRVTWVGGGSPNVWRPCADPDAPHRMPGHEHQVASAIASFALSVR